MGEEARRGGLEVRPGGEAGGGEDVAVVVEWAGVYVEDADAFPEGDGVDELVWRGKALHGAVEGCEGWFGYGEDERCPKLAYYRGEEEEGVGFVSWQAFLVDEAVR